LDFPGAHELLLKISLKNLNTDLICVTNAKFMEQLNLIVTGLQHRFESLAENKQVSSPSLPALNSFMCKTFWRYHLADWSTNFRRLLPSENSGSQSICQRYTLFPKNSVVRKFSIIFCMGFFSTVDQSRLHLIY
jgi:hypothetical protein